MKKDYKIAIVGFGGFGHFLYNSWKDFARISVKAVADLKQPKDLSKNIRYYTDYQPILQDPDIDIVIISTPPDTHAKFAFSALENEKHVLVEKPMALNLSDAKEYKIRSAKVNKVVMINYMLRFNPIIIAIQNLADTGLLGNIRRVVVENYAQDDALNKSHWFWNHRISGGILVEHGVHFFDLINSFAQSHPEKISGHSYNRNKIQQDQVIATVKYKSGLIASFYHQFSRPGIFEDTSIRLVFDLATVDMYGWIPISGKFQILINSIDVEKLSKLPNLDIKSSRRIIDIQDESRPAGWGDSSNSRMDQQIYSSGLKYDVDTIMEGKFSANESKGRLYSASLCDLMKDFINTIENPNHKSRITLEDGISSLSIALEAQEKSQTKEIN
jgi:predicted dehydrogenase